ncbi:MAG: hypothetical protein EOP00_03185 [Pedobacter sp.]|nr:MAG: hypothetical protein EOP00_03185 [Pedobacter sp.]
MILEPLHKRIIAYIENTNKPIFLTGKAGTGKTTFLRHIRSTTKKNLAVVAPTAVAAINAGGATIHSFFQMPFGPILPPHQDESVFAEFSGKSFGPDKAKIIKHLDLLIIDEISMVRSDTIDYMDRALRFVKGNNRPFGGVQLLMIGDLYQLPPVFQQDWHLLGKFYKGPYFFDSLIFREFSLLTFELNKVHRQSDPVFLAILNEIRNGAISENLLLKLNENHQHEPNAEELADHVTLTTHNPLVKKINEDRLSQLPGAIHTFKAKITGDFPKEAFPTEEELLLKAGAMVMFIKNDSSGKKQFYNGRTAKINSINGDNIHLTFLDDNSAFEATPETWENNKYTLSDTDQKVTQTSAGSFTQFPLRLAWAITIHKSQGLTFDKAVVDVAAAFAHGQTYVALSRCRNLEGLILKEKVDAKNIITDPSVSEFMAHAQQQDLNETLLTQLQARNEIEIVIDCFDFGSMSKSWDHLSQVLMAIMPNEPIFLNKLKEITLLIHTKINPIGERFIRQEIKTITGTLKIDALRDRLSKAAGYFLPHLTTVYDELTAVHQLVNGAPFHTDYFPTINLLLEQVLIKISIFTSLPKVVSVPEITNAILKETAKYKTLDNWKVQQVLENEIENPVLHHKLLDWRKLAATQKQVLGYHIISDQAMIDISSKLPKTLTQLAKIKNVGEGKATQYGDEILKLIRQHLGENELLF